MDELSPSAQRQPSDQIIPQSVMNTQPKRNWYKYGFWGFAIIVCIMLIIFYQMWAKQFVNDLNPKIIQSGNLTQPPSNKYIQDSLYCEKDDDCVIGDSVCDCHSCGDPINTYHNKNCQKYISDNCQNILKRCAIRKVICQNHQCTVTDENSISKNQTSVTPTPSYFPNRTQQYYNLVLQRKADILKNSGTNAADIKILSHEIFGQDVFIVNWKYIDIQGNDIPTEGGFGLIGNNSEVPNEVVLSLPGEKLYCTWLKTSNKDEATKAFMGIENCK